MKTHIIHHLDQCLKYHQTARSYRHPGLRPIIKQYNIFKRKLYWMFRQTSRHYLDHTLSHTIIRHQSPLMRTLGDSDPQLQLNKIHNLALAIPHINQIIIRPGEIFSLWQCIGKTGYTQGYKDGMILIGGGVHTGPGGGLCQLANLLYWMFIHSDLTIIERYHHGLDVFPDSHRVLPFGSGATIVYNYRDLIVQNNTKHTYQIIVSLTDNYLKGQLRCDTSMGYRYHVTEQDHCFIETNKGRRRYNQLYQQKIHHGSLISEKPICINCSPVLYDVDTDKLAGYGYTLYTHLT